MSTYPHPLEAEIIAVATSLLSEVGPSFTMEQLQKRLNVSRATIYRSIGSKQALLARIAAAKGLNNLQSHDTRSRILNAARHAIRRQGLVATTMEDIAQEAGVGVATLYRQFGDKESLLQAYAEEMTPRRTLRAVILSPDDDMQASLTKITRTIIRFFHENVDLLRMGLLGGEAEKKYLKKIRNPSESTLKLLTNYLKDLQRVGQINPATDAEELALALIGLVLAFTFVGPYNYGIAFENPEEKAEFIVDLFLQGA